MLLFLKNWDRVHYSKFIIFRNCIDYVDVATIYRQIVDGYDSSNSEEEVEVAPSTSRNLRTLPNRSLKNVNDWKVEAVNLVDALWKCEDSIPFRSPVNPQRYPGKLVIYID